MSRHVRVPLLVFIAAIVVLEFPGVRDLVRTPYSGIETQNLIVQNVDPFGPNANSTITRGDEITRVDGERVRNYNHLRAVVAHNHDMAPQTYTLQRGDSTVDVLVRYSPVPTPILYRRFAFLLVGFTFLFVGVLVLVRRTDPIGTLFALTCTIIAYFVTDRPVTSSASLQLIGELVDDATILFFPAVFLHFFLVFHDRPLGLGRRERVLRYIKIYAPPLSLFVVASTLTVMRFVSGPQRGTLVTIILMASTLYVAAYLVSSLVVFARNYRSSSVGQRQKLRVAILGTVVGIVPFMAMLVWRQISTVPHDRLELVSVAALAFVSISFGYSILKHGAIEVNIVVRKSLVYAVFTGVVIAGYYTIVDLAGEWLTHELKLKPVYLSFGTVLVLALIFAPAREMVQRVADRLFFRRDYDYNREVVEFNRELTGTLRRHEIFALFFHRMDELLRATWVAIYAAGTGGDDWTLQQSTGGAPRLPEAFPRASLLGRYLMRYNRPLLVEFLDYSWGKRNLDEPSSAFLHRSSAAVCLSLGESESPRGVVVLGPKRSGQLYNQTDSDLLQRFTEQLSLVLDNATLHETAIEQERLKNEVLLAREIQLALLPTEAPRHSAVNILGRMSSSVEVGGDYYDYFALDDDRIAIAIGDSTGKGVPAAMLMSSLQAVFKNLAVKDKLHPAALVTELNRHMCSSAKNDQFATFFYGVLDTRTSTFTFCNAGHCPTLLCRDRYVDRLIQGGLPLGVDVEQGYEEGCVRIDPGNLLCLYTDGVSEQPDAEGELFGEARLIQLLQTNRNLPADAVYELLFAEVLAFGDGRQYDDLTTVIVSYLAT